MPSAAPGLALLGKQTRVLHRNYRLCGKAFQERDLPVRERTYLLAVNRNCTQEGAFLAQRYDDIAPRPTKIDNSAHAWIAGAVTIAVGYIENMNNVFTTLYAAARFFRTKRGRIVLARYSISCWDTVHGDSMELLAVIGRH